ncbi:MAG: serine/threonine protein kinase [Deltaproteobacteria bacterium]|nr:serine/threonine protein kinase [Deltaproteobacteria bacterium]MDQ3299833.1 serine/threonine protein kinase [Myxococcota bacterium]
MQPGEIIGERFQIQSLASTGGMGSIYRAIDLTSGNLIAIKLMRDHVANEKERFQREARMLAELDHPNIVRFVAHGAATTGALYLAMEWLDGEDLASRLRRGPLEVDEALALIGRAASALGFAHLRGIVHRDIKPSNLFIATDGEVRVIDFGIARVGGQTAVTRTGAIVGTIGYMAPEQASGSALIDARVDVFALGCVLFECLTGRATFAGEQLVAVLTKVLFEDPPSASSLRNDLSPELDALLARMLAKQPAQRPIDGAAVAAMISRLGAAPPVATRLPAQAALTHAEQRAVSVVLAAGRHTDTALADTRPEAAATIDELRHVVGGEGARIAALAGGALAVVISGGANAADQAIRAARSALAIRAARPDAPIAVATGRALLTGGVPVGEAIDRAARLLRNADVEGRTVIAIDDITAGLVGVQFEIRGEAHLELVAEQSGESTRTLLGRATLATARPEVARVFPNLWAERAPSTSRTSLLLALLVNVTSSTRCSSQIDEAGVARLAPAATHCSSRS